MTFGEQWGWGSSAEESMKVLDRYLELGGNFLDTANIYTKGYSEHFIGEYFAKKRLKIITPSLPGDKFPLVVCDSVQGVNEILSNICSQG
jgi:predicted aldo/keto reductase-like oxidoreductase